MLSPTSVSPAESRVAFFSLQQRDHPAVIEADGRTWSRGRLSDFANQIAHGLRARSVRPGETVAILSLNCIEFLAAYLGATDIGAYVVPINWHLAPAEIAYILQNSAATVLFVHERLAPLVRLLDASGGSSGLRAIIAFGSIAELTSVEQLAAAQPTERVQNPLMGRMLVYTSATSGRPKGVTVPLRDAELALSRTIEFFGLCGVRPEEGNVHLCASMLYHAGPLDCAVVALHMGHPVVLVEKWEPELLLRLIQQHRITTSFMVPAMMVRLLKLPSGVRNSYDISGLRLVVHSGAPCPPEAKRELLDWWGPVVWEGYGAAEGSGTAVGPLEWIKRPGTVGRAIPGSQLRILDDGGNELPAGGIGTIYFTRYTGDRFEYMDAPEATRAAYRGELFTVGDVGYLDEEGYLFICDRKIDLIICGGVNVYPAEIEHVLVQHPNVADCAVFGVPDSLMGESVHAIVQPMPGIEVSAALTSELISFLIQRISVIKVPRKIEYSLQLPRDPNGKLFKRLLREEYVARRAARSASPAAPPSAQGQNS